MNSESKSESRDAGAKIGQGGAKNSKGHIHWLDSRIHVQQGYP